MKEDNTIIGVLDIQGSVEEHAAMLGRLDHVEVRMVKKLEYLKELDGLVIPGGESTVMAKLMREYELDVAIKEDVSRGMCVYGTCAGAILVSSNVKGEERFAPLGLIDITVQRNGYGRQLDSFETVVHFDDENISAVFIRAPQLTKVGKGVQILSTYKDEIVAVRNQQVLVTTFHPELTDSTVVHRYFVEMCIKKNPT
ncbi:MAG: pyridoxal 5'-phosphate synthase glutaminase subunit PdxT [Candidatus Magasanikbacteria bacterium CG10_big_fil_rev_8_21_14_0_10_43_6]|uniref:Pyridoxal 5'-phosphate synthase subunit PdxT n=1 Tax=Candidatus Magasanikbacteria bacterium CG10_big_fil_rev_8_21_14_0_10_43_6 TaxID=1974650 RepID=A0A2M6W294_9BACT|nr:MAG: pyridoxal 5'-phosphate synthase glutaminase subunit PdxT [Candidatus Magasanikbacteria bacterium CG10_big_fil_rev_8_21_14_0_10_43_6]